ncbi:MAG: DapH/DapD/GlmU-related protein [Betaproteobacteria bacterium]|nr:DapH/DapD/GlmU-related protein [Betaproteobacteria bacterium]
MRRISAAQIVAFVLMSCAIVALGISATAFLFGTLPLGDFRGVALTALALVLTYLVAFLGYRLFLRRFPLTEGEIDERSPQEFAANINILFYLIFFNPLIRTHVIPVPLLRLIYLALGAKLGRNTYIAGVALDPPLTIVGDNCLIGHGATLFSHAIEGRRLALKAIRIGNEVTVGAGAILMAGVTVGDGAIVSAGAVVLKDTHIGPREVWGGVPARLLKRLDAPAATDRESGKTANACPDGDAPAPPVRRL